jgi:tetratricopeptide (TPR) repeat protein
VDQSAQYIHASDIVMSLATYIDKAVHSLFEGGARSASIDDLVREADKARDRKDWALAAIGYVDALSVGCMQGGVKVQLGHVLKEMGKFDEAERMYREFLLGNPEDADIHLQLGHLYNRKGDAATALTYYEQAQDLAPDDAEIARHVATARNLTGRVDVVRRRNAAMDLVHARKWDDARRDLRSLVMIDGEKDMIGVLANVTKEAGRLDEAEALYGCYLAYAKRSERPDLMADCQLQLGHLQKIKGRYSDALRHFLESRQIQRANGERDVDESAAEREIVACLREIYPCFIFQH